MIRPRVLRRLSRTMLRATQSQKRRKRLKLSHQLNHLMMRSKRLLPRKLKSLNWKLRLHRRRLS